MDAKAVLDVGLLIGGALGGVPLNYLFNQWYIPYKIGKARGVETANLRKALEALAKLEGERMKESKQQANQFLRIFAAIEEIRRRVGNGNKEWFDLTGGS